MLMFPSHREGEGSTLARNKCQLKSQLPLRQTTKVRANVFQLKIAHRYFIALKTLS